MLAKSLDYGLRMKYLRQANGCRTQKELGDLLGCSAGSVHYAESGKRSYTLAEVLIMVEAWGISKNDIYPLFFEGLPEWLESADARTRTNRKKGIA